MTTEKGQFNRPVYVYYAGGSPYWRQYVSGSPAPPRSSYKFDFMFFVSSVQLMGTIRVNVLDAGSGEVVKSMISKSEIYPGWKQKGLSFYVYKGIQAPSKLIILFFLPWLPYDELQSLLVKGTCIWSDMLEDS